LTRDGATAPGPITRRLQLKAISGAVAGNLIDFLDFAIFGLLAKIISTTFFPLGNPTVALLQTMMIYASSFPDPARSAGSFSAASAIVWGAARPFSSR